MSTEAPLAGRSALVTGASRGIGRHVAVRLADAGAQVWCLARSEPELRSLAGDLGGSSLVADLADDAGTRDALDRMTERLGGAPDVVVNAAGVFGLAPSHAESVKAFDASLAVNLRGPFLVNRTLLPAMLGRGSGLIVNVGSVAGRKALRGNAAYAASKAGLRGYHDVLLVELRGTGVRATLLEPAATDTSAWDPIDPDHPAGVPRRAEMLRADDVAEAVLFVVTRPDDVRIPLLQIEHA
jgi:NADP-dependent 3-hydroxy acid dehydrogenase YdfG